LTILRKSVGKIQVSLKSERITGTLHEDQYAFLIISRSFLLRMGTVSDKRFRPNQNTRFMFSNIPLPPENRAVYEMMWKNIVQLGKP
jgi:hypothetical protein